MRGYGLALALAAGFLLVNRASAEVLRYELLKGHAYEQTGNAAVSPEPTRAVVFSEVGVDPADFSGVVLTGPPAGPVSYDGPLPFGWVIDREFATPALLDAAYPDNEQYAIVATRTGGGIVSESIAFSTAFPTQVPSFNGTVFDRLQGMHTSAGFTFTFDASPAGVEAFVFVDNVGAGEFEVFDAQVSGLTEVTMPAGTLEPGTDHAALLVYFLTAPDQRDGFDTGEGRSGHVLFTELFFTTANVPEPAAAAGILLCLGLVGHRRKR